MNDFEKLKSVFDAMDCKYTADTLDKTETLTTYDGEAEYIEYDAVIHLENGVGYHDFFCEFYFLNGTFQCHGCWE